MTPIYFRRVSVTTKISFTSHHFGTRAWTLDINGNTVMSTIFEVLNLPFREIINFEDDYFM